MDQFPILSNANTDNYKIIYVFFGTSQEPLTKHTKRQIKDKILHERLMRISEIDTWENTDLSNKYSQYSKITTWCQTMNSSILMTYPDYKNSILTHLKKVKIKNHKEMLRTLHLKCNLNLSMPGESTHWGSLTQTNVLLEEEKYFLSFAF